MLHRRLFYIYLLNVPRFSSRDFNKIKRTSRLGRLLALSLEILSLLALQLQGYPQGFSLPSALGHSPKIIPDVREFAVQQGQFV